MKIIDKTPLINEKGELGFIQRIQGSLEFGFQWAPELEAQKTVITQLDSVLEKGFTLIRNLTLHNSQIVEPIILLGPPGVYVIKVTALSGFYEAKGGQWNTVVNGHASPAQINLLSQTGRLARALQVFIDKQGVSLPGPVEPVLIATSPAMHIDSLRPTVRVIMSDGVKQFASSLVQARPIFKSEYVYDLAERIITPRPKSAATATAEPVPAPPEEPEIPGFGPKSSLPPSRAQAIFHAREESKPFDPNDLSFAFDENAKNDVPENLVEKSPSQRLPPPAKKGGLQPRQLILLAVGLLAECCILGVFGYLIISHRATP
jgi:hypothetical protein